MGWALRRQLSVPGVGLSRSAIAGLSLWVGVPERTVVRVAAVEVENEKVVVDDMSDPQQQVQLTFKLLLLTPKEAAFQPGAPRNP